MSVQRERTLRAKIATPPQSGTTQKGNGYINFDIEGKSGRGVQACTVWDSMAGGLDKQSLIDSKVGDVITVRGFDGDTGAFVVKWFQVEGGDDASLEKSERQRIFDYAGGEGRFRESQESLHKERTEQGFVLCVNDNDTFFYEKKDRCHKMKGPYWRRKIDYCMDVLGPRKVQAAVCTVTGGKLSAGEILRGFNVEGYKQILDKLYKEALMVDGDNLRNVSHT